MIVIGVSRSPCDVTIGATQKRHQLVLRHDRRNQPWRQNAFMVPLPCRSVSTINEFIPLSPFRSRSRPSTSPAIGSSGTTVSNMQRNSSVGIAKFYDWSEPAADRDDYLSVSRLYREIANIPKKTSLSRAQSERARPWPANGEWSTGTSPGSKARVRPGRMFLRDKGVLTKGEREIIEGIYKNRGDLRRDQAGVRSEYIVRSHHDAWLVGKHYRLNSKPSSETPRHAAPPPSEGPGDVTAPTAHSVENPHLDSPREGDGVEEHGAASSVTCAMCLNEKQLKQQQVFSKKQSKTPLSPTVAGSGLHPASIHEAATGKGSQETAAPPSSPDAMSSRVFLIPSPPATVPRHPGLDDRHVPADRPQDSRLADAKTSQWNSKSPRQTTKASERIVMTSERVTKTMPERGDVDTDWQMEEQEAYSHSEISQDSDDSKRRLHVKVFLPKVTAEPVVDDITACLLQGRPVLARERPLSHHDLRPRRQEPTRPGNPEEKSDCPSETRERLKEREGRTNAQHHCIHADEQNCLVSKGEVYVDDRDQHVSVSENNVSSLIAEMKDLHLLDE